MITENTSFVPVAGSIGWKNISNIPVTYNMSIGDGLKKMAFWVKDIANNINTGLTTKSIILDTVEPSLNIYIKDNTFGIGVHSITINFNEQLMMAPDLFYVVTYNSVAQTRRVTINSSINNEGKIWKGTCLVSFGDSNGIINFTGRATDNAGNVGTTIYGYSTFNINTVIPNPTTFNLYDTDTLSTEFVNDFVLGVQIKGDQQATKWMINDTQETKPTLSDPGWIMAKPNTYTLKNVVNGYKKIYLWVQDSYGNINDGVVSATIYYDDTHPEPIIEFNHRDYLKVGSYRITVNIENEVISMLSTPDVYVNYSGQGLRSITINSVDQNRFTWIGTVNISSLTPENKATINVVVTDNSNNTKKNTKTFIVDRTPPSNPVFDISDPFTRSKDYTNQQSIKVSININADIYKWYITDSAINTPDYLSIDWLLSKPAAFSFTSTNIGSKNIRVWVQDKAGNVAGTISKSIYFDNKIPTASIRISPFPKVKAGQVFLTLNISEKPKQVTLSYTLSGQQAKVVTISQVTDQQYVGSFNVVSNDPNGEAIMKVQILDYANNLSTQLVGNIIFSVDTVVPQISIESNPQYFLNRTNLYMTIDVTEVISNTPSVIFSGDITKSISLQKTNLKQWKGSLYIGDTLGYNRLASINIHISDDAGNTNTLTRNFEIDTNVPNVTVVSLDYYPNIPIGQHAITINVSEWNVNTPNIYFETIDNAQYIITVNRGVNNTWVGFVNVFEDYPEGVCTIHVSVKDYANNQQNTHSGISTFNILISLEDPSFNISDRDSGDQVYTNEYIISVDIGNDSRAIKWMLSETQKTRPVWNSSGWQDVRPASYTLIPGAQGIRKVYLWTQDAAKNVNKNAVSENIILDTLLPVASIVLSRTQYINEGEVSLTLSISEDTTQTPNLKRVYSNGTSVNMSLISMGSNLYVSTFNIAVNDPQGTTIFEIRTTDNALNIQTAINGNNSFILDTKISTPSFAIWDQDTLRPDYSNDSRVGVTINAESDIVYWVMDEMQKDLPLLNSDRWSSNKPVEYTFKDVLNGKKIVYLWVKDRAGNRSPVIVTSSIIYDTVFPTVSIKELYDPTVSENAYFITLNISEETDHIPSLSYIINDQLSGSVQWIGNVTNSAVWTGIIDVSAITHSIKVTFDIFVMDKAGNYTVDRGSIILVDNPTLSITDRSNGNTSYTNENIISINVGNDQGMAKWLLSETKDSRPLWNDSGWASVRPDTFILAPGTDGVRRLYVWVQDANHHVNNDPIFDTIYLDTTPPTAAIRLSRSGYVGVGEISANVYIREELMITPEMRIRYSDESLVSVNLQRVTVNQYTFTMNVVNTDPQGHVYFETLLTDKAGNTGNTIEKDSGFILDTKISTPSFVMWDQDSLRTDYTNDLRVGISLNEDADYGSWLIDEMQKTIPQTNSNRWINSKPDEYTFKDAINGTKNVYLWVKDHAGNISNMLVTDSIIYDSVAPVATLYTYYDSSASSNNFYHITLNLTEVTDYMPTLNYNFNNQLIGSVLWNTGVMDCDRRCFSCDAKY